MKSNGFKEFLRDEYGETRLAEYSPAIDLYNQYIRSMLGRGQDVEIDGVGVLHPYVRNVKNSFGRDYSIKVELKQNPGFKDHLIRGYENNKNMFKRKGSK